MNTHVKVRVSQADKQPVVRVKFMRSLPILQCRILRDIAEDSRSLRVQAYASFKSDQTPKRWEPTLTHRLADITCQLSVTFGRLEDSAVSPNFRDSRDAVDVYLLLSELTDDTLLRSARIIQIEIDDLCRSLRVVRYTCNHASKYVI